MKKFGLIALGLVVILGIAVYMLLGNLDGLVKNTIENVGTELTGTRVQLSGVEINLGNGSATLRGLEIDNPPGYTSDYAFELDRVTVAIDLSSLSGSVIVLNEVTVEGARLNAEQKAASSNLSDILRQVHANAKTAEQAPVEEETPSEPSEIMFAVKKFVVAGTQATVLTEVQEPITAKIPDLRRNNIGSPEAGLTPAQLGDALLGALIEEVQAAAKDILADRAMEAAKDKLREKIGLPVNKR